VQNLSLSQHSATARFIVILNGSFAPMKSLLKTLFCGASFLCVLPLFAAISVNAQEQTAAAADSQKQKKSDAEPPDAQQAAPAIEDSTEIAAVPNRPTFATTAETVQRGVFEIEYGVQAGAGHQNVNGVLNLASLKPRVVVHQTIRSNATPR